MTNRFGPNVILFPTAQIRARLAADERARRKRTIVVGQPWGWLWWPGDRNPVATDPDIDDGRRTSRAISTMHVDWLLVLHAARYAVGRLPTDAASLLALSEVEVRVPIPLTDEEHILAQSWVGPASPVTYWYEQDIVQDGRHRLWLTRDQAPRYQLPVFSTNLAYLADARAGHIPARVTLEEVRSAQEWWSGQEDHLRETASTHLRVLTEVETELAGEAPSTAPEPA
ncbi:hypothetical protein [Nocardioides sp. KR10-350]|uniref:hypothetical protein n=1 Tax=Nocardioides cheoyonin TaxID=3156615 RepID=UPI0032B43037